MVAKRKIEPVQTVTTTATPAAEPVTVKATAVLKADDVALVKDVAATVYDQVWGKDGLHDISAQFERQQGKVAATLMRLAYRADTMADKIEGRVAGFTELAASFEAELQLLDMGIQKLDKKRPMEEILGATWKVMKSEVKGALKVGIALTHEVKDATGKAHKVQRSYGEVKAARKALAKPADRPTGGQTKPGKAIAPTTAQPAPGQGDEPEAIELSPAMRAVMLEVANICKTATPAQQDELAGAIVETLKAFKAAQKPASATRRTA